MSRPQLLGWLVVLSMSLGTLVGCQPPSEGDSKGAAGAAQTQPAASGGRRKVRIAVIPKGTTHEFWKSVHYGALEAAKEAADFEVEILWKGPLQESDRDGQISITQNFITQRVDGICLAPLDSRALVGAVEEARREDIPVVIFDSALEDESMIVSYVATDNYRGGQLAAEEMARQLDGKGGVILLRYTTGSESTEQREQGFLDKLKEYPGIEIVSSDQYCGTTPESSLDKAQQMLATHEGKFQGIFAVCEPNATGVLGALEGAGLAGKVVFIGFDPSPRMVEALGQGQMQGIVLQDPERMGRSAVEAMLRHLRGEQVEPRIVTGEHVATPENRETPEMRTLLAPPQAE